MALPLKPKNQEEKDRIAENIMSESESIAPKKNSRTQSGEYGHYNIFISRELRAKVRAAATLQRMTMNEFIIMAITKMVKSDQ